MTEPQCCACFFASVSLEQETECAREGRPGLPEHERIAFAFVMGAASVARKLPVYFCAMHGADLAGALAAPIPVRPPDLVTRIDPEPQKGSN